MPAADSSPLSTEVRRLPFLVAEDNAALQKSIVHRLTDAGVKTCEAVANGQDAWRFWKDAARVAVIIASDTLPGLAGIELLKRVRADTEVALQPAFLLMSADEGPKLLETAVKEGADCVAIKPFPLGSLYSLVAEGVAHRKQMAGQDVFIRGMEISGEEAGIRAELYHERRSEQVQCDLLAGTRCVIVADHNIGLGTVLQLRFMRPGKGGGAFDPLKGQVMKMERISGVFGTYRVHIQFSDTPKDEHGIRELLLSGDEG